MHSCLYVGSVHHRRTKPLEHRFRYRVFMVYLDLDELETVFNDSWLWSTRRSAIARFRRTDYLGDATKPLADSVRTFLLEHELSASGPIRLLTNLRYFGYGMNPLSLYYCFDQDEQLEAVVAEVSNTPWGERHCYALRPEVFDPQVQLKEKPSTPKRFHVSPFMPMQQAYRWRITSPQDKLHVEISNWEQTGGEEQSLFSAQLDLHRRELNRRSRATMLLCYPLMTYRVVTAIYWQALKLWWKGCSYHPHPKTYTTA